MDAKQLFEYISTEKPIALLAPSFPVDFTYPEIISILESLGCSKVVELTYAAKLINNKYHEHFKNRPEQARICTNCPTIVQYIKNKHPEHKDKLMPIASPMIVMSRFLKKEHGTQTKTLFIGPCLAKKIEAKTTGEVDEAITFQELQAVREYVQTQGITTNPNNNSDFDDYYNNYTKIYPLTWGVAETLHAKDILQTNQVIVCDGIPATEKAIQEIENNPNIKFIDPLSCPGGCIGGPGVISKETTEEKTKKIRDYQEKMKQKNTHNAHIGQLSYAEWLDYTNTFI